MRKTATELASSVKEMMSSSTDANSYYSQMQNMTARQLAQMQNAYSQQQYQPQYGSTVNGGSNGLLQGPSIIPGYCSEPLLATKDVIKNIQDDDDRLRIFVEQAMKDGEFERLKRLRDAAEECRVSFTDVLKIAMVKLRRQETK